MLFINNRYAHADVARETISYIKIAVVFIIKTALRRTRRETVSCIKKAVILIIRPP